MEDLYWMGGKEKKKPEILTPRADINLPPFSGDIEVSGSEIYFYEEVDKRSIFRLIRFIRETTLNMVRNNPSEFLKEKNDLHIDLHIHSYGGSVHSALGAFDIIKNNKIPIWTYVEGAAASAATVLLAAGAKKFTTKNSLILIHQLSSVHWGKYEDLKDQMENADQLMRLIKKIYKENTRIPTETLDEILKKDLWFDSEKCLKLGIVDEVI